MFHRVQAFCDLLDSRKEPFGFPIDPFSSALSLRGPLVHPRPNLSDLRVDLFERIAQRGQRLEQVVPVKAPEVDGAGVPGVLKEGQPGPHSRGPQAPFLGVMVSASAESTCSARIWNLLSRSRFAPADSLRWTSSLHRSIQRSTFLTCLPRSPSCVSVSGLRRDSATEIMDRART